jgi:hypothetical protein
MTTNERLFLLSRQGLSSVNIGEIPTELVSSIANHGAAFEPGLRQHPGYFPSYGAAESEVAPGVGICMPRGSITLSLNSAGGSIVKL